MDGLVDGWEDGCIRIDRWVEVVDGWMGGRMDGWVDEWMDWFVGGQMVGWMD